MTYSLAQLATRVLREASVVAEDETPSAAAAVWAQETITSEFASMQRRGINFWNTSTSSVPDEYFVVLSRRIAIPMKTSWGLIGDLEALNVKKLLEQELKELGAIGPTGAVQDVEYF